MRVISTSDFRDDLASYIEKIVSTGTPLLVGRYGKPLVKIVPTKGKEENFDDYFGFMGSDTNGKKFVDKVRRSPKEKKAIKKLRNG